MATLRRCRATRCFLLLVWLAAGCARNGAEPRRNAGPPLVFRDVAQEAGLSYAWSHGGRTPLTIRETLGHGCAFLDYDQDGLLDALLVGNHDLHLFRNLGHQRFADVTAQSGFRVKGELSAVAVGDYDNDGYPDLFVTGYGVCALYHNRGGRPGAAFEDVTAGSGIRPAADFDLMSAAAFADLDNDGRLDLITGRYIVFTPSSPQFCMFHGVKAGCGVQSYEAAKPRVFRNLGSGRFSEMTQQWGFDASKGKVLGIAVRAADAGHGVAVYLACDEEPGELFIPHGGRYTDEALGDGISYGPNGVTLGGMGADWADFCGAGRPGLALATFDLEPDCLFRCDGPDRYSEVSGPMGLAARTSAYVAWTVKFLDYDNDGWPDLFVTNGHTQDNVHEVQPDRNYLQPMQLFHNDGGRVFDEVASGAGPAFTRPIAGRGAAAGDFDNDGRSDLLVVNDEGAPLLLRNEMRTGNHWLGVRLQGSRSNRDGIGARVTVHVAGRALVQDLELAGGYYSAHDPRLHFGLGSADHVDGVEVRWPSGHRDALTSKPADRCITIVEGAR